MDLESLTIAKQNSKGKLIVQLSVMLILILLIVFSLMQVFAPKKSIQIFGFKLYLISYTGSMEPELNYNDLVLVVKCDIQDLNKGDIITFLTTDNEGDEITVTHKIVDIVTDPNNGKLYIRTKGTNLAHPDLIPVTEDGIDGTNIYIGKYAGKSEFLGNMIGFFTSKLGMIIIAVNLCLIAVIYYLMQKVAYYSI